MNNRPSPWRRKLDRLGGQLVHGWIMLVDRPLLRPLAIMTAPLAARFYAGHLRREAAHLDASAANVAMFDPELAANLRMEAAALRQQAHELK